MTDHKLSRIGWHWLLALTLLLMQQVGLRHSLSHATARDEGAPTHHTVCLHCLALHATADSIPTVVLPVFLLAHTHVLVAVTTKRGCVPRTDRLYQSRAPPAFAATTA